MGKPSRSIYIAIKVIQIKDKFNLIGKKIPEFSLPNSRGETISISDLQGEKNVLIVLFRGIQWPHCRAHAGHLGRDYDKFEEMDVYLYPILVDNIENAKKLEQKYARNKYAIFYDESKKVVKILNQQIKITKMGRMPGLIIVDKQGIIQYAYYGDSMKDIPKNDALFEVIERINK